MIGDDLDEELEAHLQVEIEENLSRAMRPDEARRAARQKFGNKTLIKENARDAWVFSKFENFMSDIAYASRMIRKTPVFAATAVFTLALGIGGNTAMFTVIRGVLLNPLNYANPDQLVRLTIENHRRNLSQVTPVRYGQIRNLNMSFTKVGAFGMREDLTILINGEPKQLKGIRISANFTGILGVKPIVGRGFLSEEDKPGGPAVAMISDDLWRQSFNGNASIVGKTVTLDSKSYTIAGVLPEQYEFPYAGIDVWLPRPSEWSMVPPQAWAHTATLTVFARLKPKVELKQAQAEMDVLNQEYARSHPEMPDANSGSVVRVQRLKDELIANVRELLWILFGAVGLVLLIACANIASLFLARAAARSREFAVRAALGATRPRLISQLLAESMLLAATGGMVGVLLAKWSLSALAHAGALNLPRAGDIRLDGAVLAFTGVLSIVTGILFGLFPSFQASRPDIADALRDRGEGASQGSHRKSLLGVSMRSLLVAGQIALSIVLLIGAALLLKSFARLRSVDPGFQPSGLLTLQIALPPLRYDTNTKRTAFWEDLLQRLEGI